MSDAPFVSHAYREIHAAFARSLARHDALIVLTGDSGVGKTTLWRSVVTETGAIASAILNPFLDFHELIHQVATDFGLAPGEMDANASAAPLTSSEPDQIRAIHRFVAAAGRPAILIVDDAHLMDRQLLNQLRALINLSSSAGGLTILLTGQPQLEDTLRRRDLRSIDERIVQRWRLGPLSKSEVIAYLAHCSPDVDAPPDDVLDTLAEMSAGIPALVSRIVDAAATIDDTTGRRQIDATAVREAAAFVRAEKISVRRRAVVAAMGVAVASAGLAVSWLGASPWRPVLSTVSTVAAPVTAPARPPEPEPGDAAREELDERTSRRAGELAARGEVNALLRLRAEMVTRSDEIGPGLPALLYEVDARLAEARLERLRLDAEAFRRQPAQ